MCVVSMVMDHYQDRWNGWPRPVDPFVPTLTPEEVEEFRKLLDRARKYDAANNEPDCELDSKRKALKALAKELGVEITFV